MFPPSDRVAAHADVREHGTQHRLVLSVFSLAQEVATCGDTMAASVNLVNKTFVITGGNSGIGLETARALLSKNAHVIVASKSRERGDAAVQELKQEASPEAKVECMQIDLASFR